MDSNNAKSPSVGYLKTILEIFGAVNFKEKDRPLKNILQELYCSFLVVIQVLFIIIHFYNTVTRATQNFPHLIDSLTEDIFCVSLLLRSLNLKRSFKELSELVQLMDHSLAGTVQYKVENYVRGTRSILTGAVVVSFVVGCGFILQAYIPLTELERELCRTVYKCEFLLEPVSKSVLHVHKLLFHVRIPFVDEYEPVCYKLIFIYELCLCWIYATFSFLSISLLPIFILFLKGQYEILTDYIMRLGVSPDGEAANNVLQKTEGSSLEQKKESKLNSTGGWDRTKESAWIERNFTGMKASGGKQLADESLGKASVSDPSVSHRSHLQPIRRSEHHEIKNERLPIRQIVTRATIHLGQSFLVTRRSSETEAVVTPVRNVHTKNVQLIPQQIRAEKKELKRIVMFHHKILNFNEKVVAIFSLNVAILFTAIFVHIALSLYQLMFLTASVSHAWPTAGKLANSIFEAYFWCICSDLLEECHVGIRRAVLASGWINCSRGTRQDVRLILRRAQASNYLSFYGGAVVLQHTTMLKIGQFAYSFVNCVKATRGIQQSFSDYVIRG